ALLQEAAAGGEPGDGDAGRGERLHRLTGVLALDDGKYQLHGRSFTRPAPARTRARPSPSRGPPRAAARRPAPPIGKGPPRPDGRRHRPPGRGTPDPPTPAGRRPCRPR